MPEADNREAGGRNMTCVTKREYEDHKCRCVWQILVHGKISQNLGTKTRKSTRAGREETK